MENSNISPITPFLNHVCDIVLRAALTGGIGYLYARAVKQIDPRVGLICGVVAGTATALFAAEGSNSASKIIGAAALLFLPFQLCQKLELPVTFKATLILAAACNVSYRCIEIILIRKVMPEVQSKFEWMLSET